MVTEERVYDLLSHLNDIAYLQGYPLAGRMPAEGGQRGEALRQWLLEGLEHLRPPEGVPSDDPAWRPYSALRLRYLELHGPLRVQEALGLSERQVRREQRRGIAALAGLLSDALPQPEPPTPETGEAFRGAADALQVSPAALDTAQVLEEVAGILDRRYRDLGVELHLPSPSLPVYADRVSLRQVLSRILSELASPGRVVQCRVGTQGEEVEFRFSVAPGGSPPPDPDLLLECNYLAELSLGRVWAETGPGAVVCAFPTRRPALLLLVDDEPQAAELLRRCLQGRGMRVTALGDSFQVLEEAVRLRPEVIVLDVLMPGRDGWEVLQQLQSTPETRPIPVIVCSVWKDPELALTLGARDFIRKPITRPRLLQALERVLPKPGEGGSRPG